MSTPAVKSRLERRSLRPALIEQLYGIPQSTLHFYCEELPEAERLPSVKLPNSSG